MSLDKIEDFERFLFGDLNYDYQSEFDVFDKFLNENACDNMETVENPSKCIKLNITTEPVEDSKNKELKEIQDLVSEINEGITYCINSAVKVSNKTWTDLLDDANILCVSTPNEPEQIYFKTQDCILTFKEEKTAQIVKQNQSSTVDDRPFKCNYCTKCYGIKSVLTRHLRNHTGERPFKCNTCGKAFTQSCLLRKHLVTHTFEKPFRCEICGSCFTQKGNLDKHKTKHKGTKLYHCDSCRKSFSENYSLIMHIRTHAGEKLHTCTDCGTHFGQKSTLLKHMEMHKSIRPYKCEYCGKRFGLKNNFKRHNSFCKPQGKRKV